MKNAKKLAELLKSRLDLPYIQQAGPVYVNYVKSMIDNTLKELEVSVSGSEQPNNKQ